MGQLQALLQLFHDEGRLDSRGMFSLELEVARQKTAHFLLPEPGAYLLKLVQAGVSLECSGIEVRIGRHHTALVWKGPAPRRFSVTQFMSYLHNPWGEGDQDAARHLAIAVHACREETTIELIVSDEGQAIRLEVGHAIRVERLDEKLQDWQFRLQKPSPRGFIEWARRFLPSVMAEHKLLSRRCAYSPVPIELDGRRPGPTAKPAQKALHTPLGLTLTGPGFNLLSLHLVADRGAPGQCLAAEDFWRPSSSGLQTRPLAYGRCHTLIDGSFRLDSSEVRAFLPAGAPKSRQIRCFGIVTWDLSMEGPATLTAVQDGIMLNPREIDIGYPGIQVVVYGGRLKCDLSQLGLVENQEVQKILSLLRRLLRLAMLGSIPRLQLLSQKQQSLLIATLPYLKEPLTGEPKENTVREVVKLRHRDEDHPYPGGARR